MAVTAIGSRRWCFLFTVTTVLMLSSCYSLPRSRSIGSFTRYSYDRPNRRDEEAGLVTLIPQQSCYYQNHVKRLTCNCNSTDTAATLHLRMKYYVFQSENEIAAVHLQHCRELRVTLDLQRVDASEFPFHFRAIRKVYIELIRFEPTYSERQELHLFFDNVERLEFRNIFIEDTLLLTATNVKEAVLINSTFADIPARGFEVARAKSLEVRDCVFWRLKPQSIVVERTKEVTVVGNEMAVNALDVVYAKDGSHLHISCNRLLGQPVSPECSRTTTTSTTTTTTTTPPYYINNQGNLKEDERREDAESDGSPDLLELIGGVVAGIVVIIILILVIIVLACLLRKKRSEEEYSKTQPPQAMEVIENTTEEQQPAKKRPAPQPPSEPKEYDPFLLGEEKNVDDMGNDDDDDDDRPRIRAPVWLEEIQKNKIFNRQKSLLSEEGLKELADGPKEGAIQEEEEDTSAKVPRLVEDLPDLLPDSLPDPLPDSLPDPLPDSLPEAPDATGASEEEVKENSRTESDEDFDRQQQMQLPHEKETMEKVEENEGLGPVQL